MVAFADGSADADRGHHMIFRQLYEPVSSTYTYLLGCEETGRAVLIDPVINSVERDLAEVSKLGLKLEYTLDTHIHADHITSARELKQKAGSKIAAPAMDCLPCTDVGVEEGRPFQVGRLSFQPIHTPGHTDGHFAYRLDDRIFTDDALLIEDSAIFPVLADLVAFLMHDCCDGHCAYCDKAIELFAQCEGRPTSPGTVDSKI